LDGSCPSQLAGLVLSGLWEWRVCRGGRRAQHRGGDFTRRDQLDGPRPSQLAVLVLGGLRGWEVCRGGRGQPGGGDFALRAALAAH
jgi:hypothetical protein